MLSLVIAYERAAWQDVDALAANLNLSDAIAKLPVLYQEAVTWATTTALGEG